MTHTGGTAATPVPPGPNPEPGADLRSSSPIVSNPPSRSLLIEAATLPLLPLLLSFLPTIVDFRPNMDFRPEKPAVLPPPPPPEMVGVALLDDPLVRGVGLGEKSDVPDGVDDNRRSIREERDAK